MVVLEFLIDVADAGGGEALRQDARAVLDVVLVAPAAVDEDAAQRPQIAPVPRDKVDRVVAQPLAPTLADREHRGCFGKSSGGYGAILHGMKYAGTWGAVASHSGDAYFDFVYWHDWPNTLDELAKHRLPRRKAGAYDALRESRRKGLAEGKDDGRIKRFFTHVWKKEKLTAKEGHCIMNLCMAATYDPDPKAPNGFRVPFNLESGEPIAERWRKWLAHDPINLVAKHRDNLKSLRGIYIDCGWRDQYHIHYGARILAKRLAAAGIRHRYEEFDDDHSDIDYRMDASLPFLYRALKP